MRFNVLAHRFGKATLLDEAGLIDPGFDTRVLGQMVSTLGRFRDDEIPVDAEEADELRRFFAAWATELVLDQP
ncbi:hypothetical protein [Nocardioides jishulii]|uniref:Uncharacterized protein n=1 Tax=Nocardioides jishulii TaxID=2575440 RepID=A0A4U2YLQ9_9ACTN|nr:hypothetical protein [Nocardioides jishulii]QCX27362.1 hypothetical protein FCL41_07380 [Nocardioides jishulii]TKI62167.1 hypothetical protein FC770_07045 [Nocardioides jishulii]